jgi:Uncharacterized alpha/beta hydrolase domain (DUF2235)
MDCGRFVAHERRLLGVAELNGCGRHVGDIAFSAVPRRFDFVIVVLMYALFTPWINSENKLWPFSELGYCFAMAKNIVICCDGTGNDFDHPNEDSNVVKLHSALVSNAGQLVYYHPGVGTMGALNTRWRIAREWSRIKGLAFGAGLLANVGDAYSFLMEHYADGDSIYLIGFSRGSYTVRALASILHVYGLLCEGNQGLIPYLLRVYSQQTRAANHQNVTFHPDELFKWQFTHSRQVKIHFCGLWDTVSSYGWAYNPIKLPFDGDNPIIEIGRHAVSIHERRCYYQDNLWGKPGPGQDIKQVWFSGVHSDIGGSYVEQSCGLSKITLEWMFVEAMKAELKIDVARAETVLGMLDPVPRVPKMPAYVRPNENAMLHKSLHGPWWILEVLPHRDPHKGQKWTWPRGHMRTIPDHSYIHQMAIDGKWPIKSKPQHVSIEPHVSFYEYIRQRQVSET